MSALVPIYNQEATVQSESAVREDVWIPTACNMCYGSCSMLAHRVDGVVVKLEGNPDSPVSGGRLCAKGTAGLMTAYDPHRLKTPLRRTNPVKGIGIDPGWVEITWEEALDICATKLKELHDTDPRALFSQNTTSASAMAFHTWQLAFGSPNHSVAGGGLHCGNAAHLLGGIYHASWSLVPDFKNCNYAIYFGCSKGHGAGHAANTVAQLAADARARGMKLVVVDPMCNNAAAKATEWVPIRPGTDAALALGLVSQLLNTYDLYDVPYIKAKTNGPYLIGPDGHYVRDPRTQDPLVWDAVDGTAKRYNDETVKDFAIDGEYVVHGITCRPGFALLKEHVKAYTPERVEEITSVPAQTVRRLAKEFGEAARIGSTIVIDGVELPYRPAASIFFRGSQGHKGGAYACVAMELLNQMVGSADNVGGALGFNPVRFGYPGTGAGAYVPKAGPDGLMVTGMWSYPEHLPYPPHEARQPESMGLQELFPMGMMSTVQHSKDQEELWNKAELPYRPQILMNLGANQVMSVGNAGTVAETLTKIPFIMSFDIFLTEFSDFADIVLPDRLFLEKHTSNVVSGIFNHEPGMGDWVWTIRQPAIPDPPGREFMDVLLELADRIGMRDDYYATLNMIYGLKGEYRLDSSRTYRWVEVCDRHLKSTFGAEHGLDWFKEHGHIKWPKQVKEVYWRPFLPVRVPIYLEFFKTCGEQVKPWIEKFGIDIDLSFYEPLPDWKPCPSHEVKDPQYDLWGFYYRDPLHTNSFTMENPWLDEASLMNPYTYNITLNAETGRTKGLRNGDMVWVESPHGRRVKGRLALAEGIHPETIGFAACAGHWTDRQPIAKGKGVFYNELLELDLDHTDPVSAGQDICVKLKVYKADS